MTTSRHERDDRPKKLREASRQAQRLAERAKKAGRFDVAERYERRAIKLAEAARRLSS